MDGDGCCGHLGSPGVGPGVDAGGVSRGRGEWVRGDDGSAAAGCRYFSATRARGGDLVSGIISLIAEIVLHAGALTMLGLFVAAWLGRPARWFR